MRANIVNDQTLISRAFIPSGLVLPIRKGSDDARALQTVAENEELKNKLRNLQEENVKLQAVITDLTQVNKRWQKYNNDRQIYVQKLLNTIQDQQEQLNKIGELRAFPSTEVHTDNTKDNKNSVMLDQEVIRFQESERRLKEKIEVLEFQVKANRDDWEAEHNEKKQAVKEKEEIEQRVNLLMNELQEVKHSILEKRLPKHTLTICSSCQARFPNSSHSNDQIPVHSKLYRTAVHLPCSSQQWNNDISSKSPTNSIFSDLEIDGKDGNDNDQNISCSNSSSKCSSHHNISNSNKYNKSEENIKLNSSQNNKIDDDQCSISSSICSFKGNTECDKRNNVTDIWNIGRSSSASDSSVKHELGVSYSRASTVPLINSPIKQLKTPSNSSSTSSVALTTVEPLNNEPVTYEFSTNGGATVTSFMKIPVVKSSSAPDSKSENSIKPFKLPLDSFNMSSSSSNPPITFINSPSDFLETNTEDENVGDVGVETLTREDIICPGCGAIFPPKMHLKFLDHFESCQRINNL